MTFTIYQASVPVYARRLQALSAILDKAATYASERKIEPTVLLQARLYPDMFPLARQVQIACGHALRGPARLTGEEPTPVGNDTGSFHDLRAIIESTLDSLKKFDAKKMEGMDNREITFPDGDRETTLRGGDYLLHFSMPHFYFHLTTAYDILRSNGLEIGKDDFMGV